MKKSLIISLITIVLVLGAWVTPVKAATGSVGISTSAVTVGNTVSVTVYFGEAVKAAQFTLSYDTTKFTFNSVSGGVRYNASTMLAMYLNTFNQAELTSATFTFTAKSSGAANFNVSGLKVATATQTNIVPPMANLATSTTVNPKPDPKPPVTEPDKPNQGGNTGGNSGNSGSSSTNNGSSNNSGSTSKPSNSGSSTTTKKPTFTSRTATVYAKETVSIRDSWGTSGKLLGTLQKGKSITRTGIGSNGWDRVNYNGKTAYINSQYLTTTKPKDEKNDDNKKDNKNNTNNEANNTINNETTNNTINNEENNTINVNNVQTNTEQGNIEDQKDNGSKKKFNFVELAIIAVIVVAIVVIIISEVLAKKKSKKKSKR